MATFRPIPFYFINTADPAELTPAACREGMAGLADAGYGGCVLFNKPPTGFDEKDYLSRFWFETLESFIVAGRDVGLEIWLNDGFDYPPGDAAGRIRALKPELGQQRLRLDAAGGVEVVAVPWGFPAFELPESSSLFIELVYEAHEKHLGHYFGNGLHGIFSDCDNRRINHFVQRELRGEEYYPWSANFAEAFRRRHGYAIEPHLRAVLQGSDPQARHDYWQLAGALYQQWFANNHAWCRAHHLQYTFHTSDTGPFGLADCSRSSVFSEGDPFALAAHGDCPGTDHEILLLDGGTHYDRRYRVPQILWGAGRKPDDPDFAATTYDLRAKYAASAAHVTGRSRVMCEMFAATNFSADYQDLRRIAAWQIMQGINFIVPHAVHHRFHGPTKFFAPPEFMHGGLRPGLREFNDWLAQACELASRGTLCAAVAVVDPTAALWRGGASKRIFALCDRLNRSGCGYVIVPPDYARDHAADFALVIDPESWDGSPLPSNLPGGDIGFSGGDLHYMRRRLDDGSEFLIAANIWSANELTGVLRYGGREIRLALAPGELAVLGGPDEQYRSPVSFCSLMPLPESAAATFAGPNLLPLECWTAETGSRRLFRWRNDQALASLQLDIPAAFAGTVRCDGTRLIDFSPVCHGHDRYLRAELPALSAGWHELEFDGDLPETEPPYLCGDFDVALVLGPASGRVLRQTYNLSLLLPETPAVVLQPRRTRLQAGALAAQGQMFYTGAVTCQWELECADAEKACLVLPEVGGVCDVSLDGQPVGRAIFAPWHFPLMLTPGRHQLAVTVFASAGAKLEGGGARSGVIVPGWIGSIEHVPATAGGG